MMSHWESEKYAQNIVKVRRTLPISRVYPSVTTSEYGLILDHRVVNKAVNSVATNPIPITNQKPKMVENHFGSSDITQSVYANVTVSTNITSPGAERLARLFIRSGSPVSSCFRDQAFSLLEIRIQIPKKIIALTVKAGNCKYQPLCSTAFSSDG